MGTTFQHISTMAPMKAMKAGGKAMTKGAIADAGATKCELKKTVAAKVINSLAEIATGGEEGWHLHPPRPVPHQDSHEARHQGRQEGDLRQDDHRQGQARKEDCEGVPSCGPQGQHLNASHAAALARTSVLRGSAHGIGSAFSFGGWLLPVYIPLKHEACHSRQS